MLLLLVLFALSNAILPLYKKVVYLEIWFDKNTNKHGTRSWGRTFGTQETILQNAGPDLNPVSSRR